MNEIFSCQTDRLALEAAWLDLTRVALPAVAAARGWPVRFDHCFARILLDNACGGVWYDSVKGRPAYRHVDAHILTTALTLGRAALDGTTDLAVLNARSLDLRRARREGRRA